MITAKKELLRKRKPDVWLSLLNGQIHSARVRAKVACIVWWDYAADHMKEMWEMCYQVQKDKGVASHKIIQGLMRVGYDEAQARKRIAGIEKMA